MHPEMFLFGRLRLMPAANHLFSFLPRKYSCHVRRYKQYGRVVCSLVRNTEPLVPAYGPKHPFWREVSVLIGFIKTISIVTLFLLVPGVSPGQEATPPQLKLKDIQGRSFRLSDYRGKIVLINFWATWCPPCRVEIPDLVKL